MVRGHKEASTSHAGCKRGTPRETLTISSLVTAMFVEELRSLRQIPITIILEASNDTATPTIGGADNASYFT